MTILLLEHIASDVTAEDCHRADSNGQREERLPDRV